MAYATSAQMVTAFGAQELYDLTNHDNPLATTVNEPVAEQALADASATIDGYLQEAGYVLPLAVATPPILRHFALDIARYFLDDCPIGDRDFVRVRYNDAIAWLQGLAKGKNSLGLPKAEAEQVAPQGGLTHWQAPEPTFGSAALRGYRL